MRKITTALLRLPARCGEVACQLQRDRLPALFRPPARSGIGPLTDHGSLAFISEPAEDDGRRGAETEI